MSAQSAPRLLAPHSAFSRHDDESSRGATTAAMSNEVAQPESVAFSIFRGATLVETLAINRAFVANASNTWSNVCFGLAYIQGAVKLTVCVAALVKLKIY